MQFYHSENTFNMTFHLPCSYITGYDVVSIPRDAYYGEQTWLVELGAWCVPKSLINYFRMVVKIRSLFFLMNYNSMHFISSH